MKFKMRKVKSWLRWAKKRYEERYGIKIQKMTFPKNQLKMALLVKQNAKKEQYKCAGKAIKIGRLRNDI